MAKVITEEDLRAVQCNDFSIVTLPNGKDALVLICETKEGSNLLIDLLHEHPFDLKVTKDAAGNYALICEFIDSEFAFRVETKKTETSYPPVLKLQSGNIRFITTGVWTNKAGAGRMCEYHAQIKRLGQLNIAHALSQAEQVQFVPGKRGEKPSAIVLIFKDYDHIFSAEADEAYNLLIKRTKGKPKLEITSNGSQVRFKIWDILFDLEEKIDWLKYSREDLKQFLEETDPDHSFAFVLGFHPTGGAIASIASTKSGGSEMITLCGYIYKDK